MTSSSQAEWLETDGQGGFASGTVSGIRTRRYHGLLITATTPPEGRILLVAGLEIFLEADGQRYGLSPQRYWEDVIAPPVPTPAEFHARPWPRWIWHLGAGLAVEHEIFIHRTSRRTCLSWRLLQPKPSARLVIRPFLAGRDYHSTHHENGAFQFAATTCGQTVSWHPYDSLPAIACVSNGTYSAEAAWYRNFQYTAEQARGLDFLEDLAAPGIFTLPLEDRAVMIFSTDEEPVSEDALTSFQSAAKEEHARRASFPSDLHLSADAYIVAGRRGTAILAGYPWFADWGRDTFIALRGLCIATGRLADACAILRNWAGQVSEGMLPNRFPDSGQAPEFNSVDASLWYIIAVHDFLLVAGKRKFPLPPGTADLLWSAVEAILLGYTRGTRHRIQMDPADGLLSAGEPGQQLTWMDARVGDRVMTPRIGKPVEIQALWINALWIARTKFPQFQASFEKALKSFLPRFWNEPEGCLFDVIDCDQEPGRSDGSVRPNQVFAVGGLPLPLVQGDKALRIAKKLETQLLTPLGLRTLEPGAPGYVPHYRGGVAERDGAYHEGTAWPFLMGAFTEAWLRVRGDSPADRKEATRRFLAPLTDAMSAYGIGHLAEIADAEAPFTPVGCPFQAWSLGEYLRLKLHILQLPA